MKNVIVALAFMAIMNSCDAQKTSTTNNEQKPGQNGPPSVEEVFKMDANKDNLLSKAEVKGPLLKDFDKIDTNKDGFVSKAELQNAPKPEKGQGPPPRN